jgi:hypothetical protein
MLCVFMLSVVMLNVLMLGVVIAPILLARLGRKYLTWRNALAYSAGGLKEKSFITGGSERNVGHPPSVLLGPVSSRLLSVLLQTYSDYLQRTVNCDSAVTAKALLNCDSAS